jgi:hypothetical protein
MDHSCSKDIDSVYELVKVMVIGLDDREHGRRYEVSACRTNHWVKPSLKPLIPLVGSATIKRSWRAVSSRRSLYGNLGKRKLNWRLSLARG